MSSDALFLPSISNVPGMTQATPRMKFRSDRYAFYKEQQRESEKPTSQDAEAKRSQKTRKRTASRLEPTPSQSPQTPGTQQTHSAKARSGHKRTSEENSAVTCPQLLEGRWAEFYLNVVYRKINAGVPCG